MKAWDAPFDESSETSPRVRLARKIAKTIRGWIKRGDLVGVDAEYVGRAISDIVKDQDLSRYVL